MLFALNSALLAETQNQIQEDSKKYVDEQTNLGNEINATKIARFANGRGNRATGDLSWSSEVVFNSANPDYVSICYS